MKTVCQYCKKEYEDTTYRIKKGISKFCSTTCYANYKKEQHHEIRKCKLCGTEFECYKKTKREFCSDQCRIIWSKTPEIKSQKNKTREKTVQNLLSKDPDYYKKIDKKTTQPKLERYGDENYVNVEKNKQTKLERYGDENYRDIKKQKQTKLERYGDENYNNRIKFKKTIEEKYGEFHLRKPEILNKQKQTRYKQTIKIWNEKLLKNDLELVDEFIGSNNEYTFRCLKCGNTFKSWQMHGRIIPRCQVCFPTYKQNKLQIELENWLKKHDIFFISNERTSIKPFELDIYIPEYNLAIEINGNYWHSETNQTNKHSHLNKTIKCNNKGIKLIQIFEDEWQNKREIIFSRIANMLQLNQEKIYARKCIIKEINVNESRDFLLLNHIQGWTIDKIRYGLFYNDMLVSVMTFSKERISLGNKSKKDVWEMNRFVNKLNTTIIGGFSKLLKHFIIKHQPEKIISYADIRWSGYDINNTVYFKNGFEFVGYTPINYWYLYKKNYLLRFHRFKFRKNILLKEGHDPKLTEWEIMKKKGYDRIWDCGNMKFELVI